jgi:hypothetical protein
VHGKEEHAGAQGKARDLVGSLETAHNGHRDVHDDDVWREFPRHPDGLLAIARFTADLPVGSGFQDPADSLSHNFVIVRDEYLYGHLSLFKKKTRAQTRCRRAPRVL